jgi:hypothetical protein
MAFSDVFPLADSLLQIGRDAHGEDYGWKAVRSVVSPTFTTGKMRLV